MKIAAALTMAALLATPVLAQDGPVTTAPKAPTGDAAAAKPDFQRCAAVYGALARQQQVFGAEASLLTEVYPNFARIDFKGRLEAAARRPDAAGPVPTIETSTDMRGAYAVLVNAESDGTPESERVKDVVLAAQACDLQYGFSPSL